MTHDHAAVRRYLHELDAQLQRVPTASREAILDDVHAHVSDAIDAGRDPEEVVAALGTPEEVARGAREQFGINPEPATAADPESRAARILNVAAVALAIITAVFVAFVLPSYATEEAGVVSSGTGSTLQTATSIFEQSGLGVALLPLLPAVLALLPLILVPPLRGMFAWVNPVLVTTFAIIAGFSIGGFFVPLALLMWAAVLVPLWVRRGASAATGRTFRALGALLLIAPALLGIGDAVTGSMMDPRAPFWIVALAVIAIGVLFGFRVRFFDVVVTILAVAIMTLAVVDAGILVLAVWWGGGLWLVVGLSAIAARRAMTGSQVERDTPSRRDTPTRAAH